MFRGKLFHSVGAAAAKDLLPKYSNRHLGGVSRWFSVDRRVRFGEYGISSSRIYAGASPFKALYVSKRILKSILPQSSSSLVGRDVKRPGSLRSRLLNFNMELLKMEVRHLREISASENDMWLSRLQVMNLNYCENVVLLGWLVWYTCPFQ